ncbi:ABC transporter permease [Phytohabitans flavus]|uniref:Polyamine ABC transporter permease n=1 Tax=Phytohabitans flavus TaxID=1076124 RepID=A0A6F8XPI9_9ACTN|nr:ABC transporter permease [Phytohabitans flavus]BCB75709.1 polyamine ABC transporter permease [Phytohabitans flavus]
MKASRSSLYAVVFLIALLVTVPTLFLIPMSLSSGTTFQFPPPGWSGRWYKNLVEEPEWRAAAVTSLKVAAMVTPLALVIGTCAAFGLLRLGRRLRTAGLTTLISPLVVPHILLALAIYGTFLKLDLSGTLQGLVLGQTALAVPFVLIPVLTRLQGYDKSMTSAALSLGAPPFTAFRTVTLPLILPGIVAGGVFAFVASFDELVIALLLQGPGATTLPVQMFNSVTEEANPTISAASTILVVVVSLVILLVQLGWIRTDQKAGIHGQ